jgi:hypothetical protein
VAAGGAGRALWLRHGFSGHAVQYGLLALAGWCWAGLQQGVVHSLLPCAVMQQQLFEAVDE